MYLGVWSRDAHFVLSFPIPTTFVSPLGQTNNIKRIKHGQQNISLVLVPRSQDLRNAIFGQVDLVVVGQEACRMSHVEQNTVSNHKQGLEDPEEPFVSNNRRDRGGVKPWPNTDLGNGEIFHCAVDCTDEDERAAAVERVEHCFQILREEIGLVAFAMEIYGEQDEARDDAELDDQSCFEEITPNVLFAFGEIGVGAVRGAVAVESFHDAGYGAKGGQNPPRMNWGVIWDVV